MHLPSIREAVLLSMSINGAHESRPRPKSSSSSTHNPVNKRVAQFCELKSQHSVVHVEALPGYIQQIFHVSMANGQQLLLKGPPLATVRLQRQERQGLNNEEEILKMISQLGVSVPGIVSYEPANLNADWPHILLDHANSVPLATLQPLDKTRSTLLRESLDAWLRSMLKVESSAFGPIMQDFRTSSWRDCFCTMFETALQEAEDMLLALPYDQIRHYVEECSFALKGITAPKLVIPRAASLHNIMVDPSNMGVTGLIDYSGAMWGDPDMLRFFTSEEDGELSSSVSKSPETRLTRFRFLL